MTGTPRKVYIDLPAGQLHCHIRDGEGPAIVFLHQTASSAACYDPLLRELDLPHRLVAVDTPGFGGSFDPEGQPTMQDYAGWIGAGIDALGIGAFHLFGHHTGASLALELAAGHPERVLSVILAGAVFMTAGERAGFFASHGEPIRPRADGGHLLENWRYAAGYNPDCPPEMMHGEVVAMLRAWRGRPQAYIAVGRHDVDALVARIVCPVLLLTSPEDYFHATLDRARAAFPKARVAVTGGGNFQPTADPKGVARAIESFLAGV